LIQPAPFFLGLLGHQFFRVIHQGTIEKFGRDWVKPGNIVTSGAFKLQAYHPYDEVIVVKNPNYWDAGMVKLDRIEFYPMEEATTMMNLYKAGSVDAMYNHVPPAAWNEVVKQYKDEYLNFPEITIEYYTINVKKPPMDNLKIRKAFALAVDRVALAKFRKTTKPLVDFSPEGIFPKYEEARTRVYSEQLKKQGSSLEEWKARIFDPEKARKILAEAGYPVQKNGNTYSCPTFPIEQVELLYNTAESNKAVAEFIQAQWKQNLGITVPLNNQEWKTFLNVRKKLEYNGLARAGWVGDYMDPFTFLNLFYSQNNDSSTGWHNPKFDKMLDDANKELDEIKRFEKLAEAELFMMQDQPVIPLQTQATNWIKKPYVKGLYPNPGTLHPWKFVYIERDPNKWDQNVENIMTNRDEWVHSQIDRLTATQEQMKLSKEAETVNTIVE
ncbi:MAG: peptide ABC transporter substrate-binding protein, partial [Blastocatellia bacterium]|nr:peptide ABC transporter substrate-binding protein [Blastocatellia bacterium]MDQ3220253.1 peptide ABC transporter substrate-binding protein [Acidobacteriota bacterium]